MHVPLTHRRSVMKRLLLVCALASPLAALVGCASGPRPHALAEVAPALVQAAPPSEAKPLAPPALARAPAHIVPVTRRERVREILPSSVKLALIEDGKTKRSASGVVIASEATSRGTTTYIITNAHAVDSRGLKDAVLTVMAERDGEEMTYVGQLLAVGSVPRMDLALIRVRGVMLPAVELASAAEIELGDDVVVAASPYGNALSISGGMISHIARDPQSRLPVMLKTDAPIGYGASGGGIFSLHSGKLLAIVEGYRTAKVGFEVAAERFSFDVPMPGETFAAPATKVRAFLEGKGFGRLLDPPTDPATAASR